MTNAEDPGERMARVRDEMARQNAKLPTVDHNGQPLSEPSQPEPDPDAAAPRLPAPNPAQGASAAGDAGPTIDDQIREARAAGQWTQVVALERIKTHTPSGPNS